MRDVPTIGLLDRIEEHVEIPGAVAQEWLEIRRRALHPAIPVMPCPTCDTRMEVSLEASYLLDGQWVSTFQMNQAVAKCPNTDCITFGQIRVYDRKPEGLVPIAWEQGSDANR